MSRIYTHYIPLKNGPQTFTAQLPVEYGIVGALGQYGGAILLPNSCPHEFLIAGGYDGLPYTGDLGRAGVSADLVFPQGVGGLFVATYSPTQPVGCKFSTALVVGGNSVPAGGGSGTSVKAVQFYLGGQNYVIVSWPNGQPLQAYQAAYPDGSIWTGPKLGYTVTSINILPIY